MQTEQIVQPKPQAVVTCNLVEFSYSNNQKILKRVSLRLSQGESVVLFGKSGSGKSTLLRCISGYNEPTAGEILINNAFQVEPQNVNSQFYKDSPYAYQIAKLWQQIQFYKYKRGYWWSYLFQGCRSEQGYMVFADCSNALPQLTTEENLHLVLAPICPDSDLSRKIIKLLLQLTGLMEVAKHKPAELSSGQLRRLCLAQALANNPGLLILDEPTNGLDFSTKTALLYFIEQLRQIVGITILSVTHDLEAALLLADRLLLFKEGQIIEEIYVEQSHPRQIEMLDTPKFIKLKQGLIDFLK